MKPKTEIFFPEIKPAIKPFPIDEPLPDLKKKYDDWLDNWLNNPLNDNVDGETENFVHDNYQSWDDDIQDVKSKTDLVLEDISDADTIDYTSDIEFIEKVPQHPRDRLNIR